MQKCPNYDGRMENAEEFVRTTWTAIQAGDFSALETSLAPDAQWRAVEDGPWNCENRAMILRVMQDRRSRILEGEVDSVTVVGDRIVVGFRPLKKGLDAWPLDNGVRYVVLTLRDGLVSELKGHATKNAALDYANAR